MIVAGIDISRKYSLPEVMEMYESGRYRNVVLNGYVVRADADGLIGFVPVSESTLARMEDDRRVEQSFDVDAMRDEVERDNPIVRRTPQQRKDAINARLAKKPVLTDAVRSAIQTEAWKRGQPVTGAEIDAISAQFLQRAEKENREADAHRVTRAHPTA